MIEDNNNKTSKIYKIIIKILRQKNNRNQLKIKNNNKKKFKKIILQNKIIKKMTFIN